MTLMKRTVTKGYKVRVFPTQLQEELFEKTFGCVRLVWNYSLMEKENIYELFKDYPELLKSHVFKTQAMWKQYFPFLKEVDSQALATVQQELISSFKNFFRGTHKFPRYKSKKNYRTSYTTHTTNNNIRIEENMIKLPKVGWVKLKTKRRDTPEDSVIKAATVSKSPTGKYYVSLRLEYQQVIRERNNDFRLAIGLDFSVPHFYIDSEGKKANYPNYYVVMEDKLKRINKKLSRQIKGSKGYERTRLALAKTYEKIRNQRKDFNHQLSRKLVNKYDLISVETLDLKKMQQEKYYSKKIADKGYHQFLTFLSYKCIEEGVSFFKANKYYASSKICSKCGTKKKTLPPSIRVYKCDCGNVLNRDVNAAINLATQAVKKLLIKNLEDRTASIAW